MNDTEKIEKSGACICGGVKFVAKTISPNVGACHCATCRKWGGGPLLAVDCGTEVEFEIEDSIKVYDSSAWAERGFCITCGSHLFYRLKHNQQYIIPVGLFDDSKFVFDHQIFIDSKPDFYTFSNETKNQTGAEVFAAANEQ